MIWIKKNPNGDTRTASKNISFEQFHEATIDHINDVKNVLIYLSNLLQVQALAHDYTKLVNEDQFYDDFLATMNDGADFISGKWYQDHVHKEKHHPLSYCHNDVNLLDIVEMIVDYVCAGKTRSGEVRSLEISEEILKKAVDNTVKLVDNLTEVIE